MIRVALNKANFEYDIHSLVKAFYPEQEVRVQTEQGKEEDIQEELCVMVFYGENTISFSFYPNTPAPSSQNTDVSAPSSQNTDVSAASCTVQKEKNAPALSGEVTVDFSNRAETKNRLKKTLYELLSQFCGRTLPWGTLTGIRPTKIPMSMMEAGESEEEIRRHMRETYFATEEKIELSIDVAKRERALLSRLDYADGYSLYVGIPFCPSTCLYCSFTSYPIHAWEKRVDDYLDALEKEICYTAEAFRGKFLNSVYIGGGTPTSLSPEQLERLVQMIGTQFRLFDEHGRIVYGGLRTDSLQDISAGFHAASGEHVDPGNHLLEFTVEAGRPDSITQEKLEVLKNHNISRISINPQTMKEETLRLIGRRHSVAQTKESFWLARSMGFDNINMDLIMGLPGETVEDVRRTMQELSELKPDNITVHSLAIKRAARLRMEKEQYAHLQMENTAETISLTAKYCREMGLLPYYLYRQKNMAGNFENVGYAAEGKAGVYNILIMEEKQTIMALGAGATTKLVSADGSRIERVGNVKDVTHYLTRVDEMIEKKEALLRQFEQQSRQLVSM